MALDYKWSLRNMYWGTTEYQDAITKVSRPRWDRGHDGGSNRWQGGPSLADQTLLSTEPGELGTTFCGGPEPLWVVN